ncbi:MAG: condensation domain-containing protein, partial [Gemmatimonadota bacterium]
MSVSTTDTFAPLSLAQERFLLVNRLVGDVPLHNLPVGWRIRGPLNVEVLSRALGYLAQRHLVLRTRFPNLADGSAVQEIRPAWQPELEIVSIPDGPDHARAESLRAWREATASRPFTLAEEPAFRASVARLASEEHVLLLVFHHIAFDGWSFGVVVRDLGAAYTAFENGREPDLTPLPLQYADYAIAQREWVKGEEAERQRARWAKILEGVPTELKIPSDRARPPSPSFRVERLRHVLPAEFRSALEEFSKATRATPFMILMAALQALLGRYTGRSDFLIGFPLANRQDRADLSALVGCFINILI